MKFVLLVWSSLFLYAQNGIDINGMGSTSFNIVQGSGVMAKKTVQLAPFKKIKVDDSFELIIQKADKYEYMLQSDDNLIDLMEVRLQDDVLIIRSKQSYQTNNHLKLIVKTKALESLMVEGSSNVELKNLNENQLLIDIDGSIDLHSSVGSVNNLSVKADGAYDLDLSQLNANNAEIDMKGSGDLQVNVKKQLNAKISDNGSLSYSGTAVVNKNISDNGYIEKK
jgi:hypothetical protein